MNEASVASLEPGEGTRRLIVARDVIAWLLAPVVLGLVFVSLLTGYPDLPWPLELLEHFRTQYLVGGLAIAAFLFAVRRPRFATLALVVGILNLRAVVPFWFEPPVPNRGSTAVVPPALRLLVANVLTHNDDHGALLALVRSEQPDFVLLHETSAAWLAALAPLESDYPHRVAEARSDNFGIALFSKRPFAEAEILRVERADVPTVVVEFDHGGARFHLIGTHPWPPVRSEGARASAAQMRAVARLAANLGNRTIVAGDFNATPWSKTLRDVRSASGLRHASRGFGPCPTWPARLPWLLRIPIDQVLHSPDLEVLDHRLGHRIGSDHLPLIVDLR